MWGERVGVGEKIDMESEGRCSESVMGSGTDARNHKWCFSTETSNGIFVMNYI